MTVDSIGILGNLLLILVIVIDPLKILHRGVWITILNLAIADFFVCAVDFGGPSLFSYFWTLAASASFMQLTLLTAQIYLIIKYPMKSKLWLTGKKVILACTIVWVLAIGLGLSSIASGWFDFYIAISLYIGNIVVIVLVVAIQLVLKILIVVETLRSRESIPNVAKTVVILNVTQILTAFPYFLAHQVFRIELLDKSINIALLEVVQKFLFYYSPICSLNFAVNPVLYTLRSRDYRRSLIALLKLHC